MRFSVTLVCLQLCLCFSSSTANADPIYSYHVRGVYSPGANSIPGLVAPNGVVEYTAVFDLADLAPVGADRIDFPGSSATYSLNGTTTAVASNTVVRFLRDVTSGIEMLNSGTAADGVQININVLNPPNTFFTGLSSSPSIVTGTFPFVDQGFFGASPNIFSGTLTISQVPEPSSLAVFGVTLGAAALSRILRRRRHVAD